MANYQNNNEGQDNRPLAERLAAGRRGAPDASDRAPMEWGPDGREPSRGRLAQQWDPDQWDLDDWEPNEQITDRHSTDRRTADRRTADRRQPADRRTAGRQDAGRGRTADRRSAGRSSADRQQYAYDEPRDPGRSDRIWKRILTVLLVVVLIPIFFFLGAFLAKILLVDKDGAFKGLPFGIGPTPVPVSSPAPTQAPTPTPVPTPTPEPTPTPVPTPPPIFDDGTDGYMSSGIYIWNDHAYELFYGGTDSAKDYASAISSYKEYLGDDITVYNMVVPNHSEFGLPKRIRDQMGCTSQRENLSAVFDNYTADVKAVDIYDNLNLHNDEYIYFNTDTHWAMLGAYYAAEVFCEVAEVEAPSLDKMNKTTPDDNFTGYLAYITGEDCLYNNPDHIDLYEPKCNYTASVSYDGWYFTDMDCINSSDTGLGYSMVLYGDNPLFRVFNHDSHTGRKIVVVKDSYGNALAPFLVNSFDEVHVVDFRHFPQNLVAYCQENGITDVLFFNNVMSANTWSQIETMNSLFWW